MAKPRVVILDHNCREFACDRDMIPELSHGNWLRLLKPERVDPFIAAQTRRRGTWGWGKFLLFILLLSTVLGGFYFFAYRWLFYLGGNFHILPMWQGVGKAHVRSGEYVFYVLIYPETWDMKTYLHTNLTGTAEVCTSRGEDIFLVLGGGMRRNLSVSTDGEEIGLYVHRRSWSGGSPQAAPPRLAFQGHWRNPNLVMDDQGTIAKAFLPDGTVAPDRNHNYSNALMWFRSPFRQAPSPTTGRRVRLCRSKSMLTILPEDRPSSSHFTF